MAQDGLQRIEHVVVLMLENRSVDHMLGYLSFEGGRADVDGLKPGMTNEARVVQYAATHEPATHIPNPNWDPDHSGTATDVQIGGGKMDGFAESFARTLESRKVADPRAESHGIARSRPIARISPPSSIPVETQTSTPGAWRCIPRGAYGGCARRAGTNGRPGPQTASGAPLAATDASHGDAPASRGRSRRSAPSRLATRLSQQSSTLSAILRSTLRDSAHYRIRTLVALPVVSAHVARPRRRSLHRDRLPHVRPPRPGVEMTRSGPSRPRTGLELLTPACNAGTVGGRQRRSHPLDQNANIRSCGPTRSPSRSTTRTSRG